MDLKIKMYLITSKTFKNALNQKSILIKLVNT